MLRTIGGRLLRLVPVLFLVSLGTFFLVELVPGDPAVAILGPDAAPEQYEAVREELGLNEPVMTRYVDWLGDTVTGDLGRSLIPPSQEVTEMIQARLPVTIQVALMAMAMALLVSIPIAMGAAYRPGRRFDRIASGSAFAAISVPAFLVGLLLVFTMIFHSDSVRTVLLVAGAGAAVWAASRVVRHAGQYSPGSERNRYRLVGGMLVAVVLAVTVFVYVRFPAFPRQGFSRLTSGEGLGTNLRHAFLPAVTLAITEIAVFMRLLRGDLISTLQEDFILSARAKGMPAWRIMVRDALRPSSFSLITVAGVSFGRLIGGTVIVEAIFNLPGMGTLIVESIGRQDVKVVQSAVLVIAVFYVLVNLAVDISYSYLDPRIRRGRT